MAGIDTLSDARLQLRQTIIDRNGQKHDPHNTRIEDVHWVDTRSPHNNGITNLVNGEMAECIVMAREVRSRVKTARILPSLTKITNTWIPIWHNNGQLTAQARTYTIWLNAVAKHSQHLTTLWESDLIASHRPPPAVGKQLSSVNMNNYVGVWHEFQHSMHIFAERQIGLSDQTQRNLLDIMVAYDAARGRKRGRLYYLQKTNNAHEYAVTLSQHWIECGSYLKMFLDLMQEHNHAGQPNARGHNYNRQPAPYT